jgi:hypothetical protein
MGAGVLPTIKVSDLLLKVNLQVLQHFSHPTLNVWKKEKRFGLF